MHDESSTSSLDCRLTAKDFEQIRSLAYQRFGLDLRDGKETLVAARLAKVLRHGAFRSIREYCEYVRSDRTGEGMKTLIDALTTNHTGFFREEAHFHFLQSDILPGLKHKRVISIWSAGCSTGEEPYSIAICTKESLPDDGRCLAKILATDISTRALAAAEKGIYTAAKMATFRDDRLRRSVLRGSGAWQNCYRIRPDIREMVSIQRLNLMEPFGDIGLFDVIFCRNVMIYFDKPTQQIVVNRLADRLHPGGHLLIGHAESLAGVQHPLRYVRPAVYRKPDPAEFGLRGRRLS